ILYLFFAISIDFNPHASPFEQNRVAPHAVHFSDSLTPADFAKSAALMHREAANILGKYSSLQGPDSILLRFIDKRIEEFAPDTYSSSLCRDVNTDFRHSAIHAALRHRTERRPADDCVGMSGD